MSNEWAQEIDLQISKWKKGHCTIHNPINDLSEFFKNVIDDIEQFALIFEQLRLRIIDNTEPGIQALNETIYNTVFDELQQWSVKFNTQFSTINKKISTLTNITLEKDFVKKTEYNVLKDSYENLQLQTESICNRFKSLLNDFQTSLLPHKVVIDSSSSNGMHFKGFFNDNWETLSSELWENIQGRYTRCELSSDPFISYYNRNTTNKDLLENYFTLPF